MTQMADMKFFVNLKKKIYLGYEQLGHCQFKCEQFRIEAIQRRVHHLCQNPDVRLKDKHLIIFNLRQFFVNKF